MREKSMRRAERRRSAERKRLQRWEFARIVGWSWTIEEADQILRSQPRGLTADQIRRVFGRWRNHHLSGRKKSRRGDSREDYTMTRQQLWSYLDYMEWIDRSEE